MKKIISFIVFTFIITTVFAQKQFILESGYLSKPDTILVYTPDDYKTVSYPVIYLLHGYSANYKSWNTVINLKSYSQKYKMVIVTPDALYDSWYFDSPQIKKSNYESFFIHDLMPKIENEFNIDKSLCFIDGISMGGHGAMYLFLRNIDLFKAVGSSSGVLNLRCSGLRNSSLKNHLGEYDSIKWAPYTSISYLENNVEKQKPMIVDCGIQDHLIDCNREFVNKANSLNLPIMYVERPGVHNSEYWKKSIWIHFEYFSRIIQNEMN